MSKYLKRQINGYKNFIKELWIDAIREYNYDGLTKIGKLFIVCCKSFFRTIMTCVLILLSPIIVIAIDFSDYND